ncbi:hypothetical protein L3X38_045079 [Prunus dulcis]|uniref:Uncharacterized protein n=1 Tax=Prunus dulcis TaxID=3755 RepID=A0AAD4V068_PRUDU|nr:hypothetical protein L3X38_045079 [Prunus dulcis]
METMDTPSNVNPSKSLLGNPFSNSFAWYRDMWMDRKMIIEVTEKHREMSEAMAKISKAGRYSRIGLPVISLVPPGTVVVLMIGSKIVKSKTAFG